MYSERFNRRCKRPDGQVLNDDKPYVRSDEALCMESACILVLNKHNIPARIKYMNKRTFAPGNTLNDRDPSAQYFLVLTYSYD